MTQDLLNLISKVLEGINRSSDEAIERTAQRTAQLLMEGWQPQQSEKEPPSTEKEMCELLHISRKTLFDWRTSGKIPSYKVGKRVYFFKSKVLEAVQGGRSREGYGNRRHTGRGTINGNKAA